MHAEFGVEIEKSGAGPGVGPGAVLITMHAELNVMYCSPNITFKITPSYNASRRARASPNISRDFQRGRKTTFIWEFFLLPRARDICVQKLHCPHTEH